MQIIYCMTSNSQGQMDPSDWPFLDQEFTVQAIAMETVLV